MIQLSKNLILQNIEPHNWVYNEDDVEVVTALALFFKFYNQSGFTVLASINPDNTLSRGYVESECGDLHDSFCGQIDDHWDAIESTCKDWLDRYQ